MFLSHLPLCMGLDLPVQSSLPQRRAVVDNVVNQCCTDLICQIRSSLSTFLSSSTSSMASSSVDSSSSPSSSSFSSSSFSDSFHCA